MDTKNKVYTMSIYDNGQLYFNKAFYENLKWNIKYVKVGYWEEKNLIFLQFYPEKIKNDQDTYLPIKNKRINIAAFLSDYNIRVVDKFIPKQINIKGLGSVWAIDLTGAQTKRQYNKCIEVVAHFGNKLIRV